MSDFFHVNIYDFIMLPGKYHARCQKITYERDFYGRGAPHSENQGPLRQLPLKVSGEDAFDHFEISFRQRGVHAPIWGEGIQSIYEYIHL
jgi:hypothetical protein